MYKIIFFELKVTYHLYLHKPGGWCGKNGTSRNSGNRTETGSEIIYRRNVLWLTRQLS